MSQRRKGSSVQGGYRGKGLRALLYSHDTLGLGHIRRNLKLAHALKARFPELGMMLVTGSPFAHKLDFPAGVDYVKLPAVRKSGPERYEALHSSMPFENTLDLRKAILLSTVREYRPQILLVDHAPVGMQGELLPTLNWFKMNVPGATAVLGLRDIIDDPVNVTATWQASEVYDVLEHLYDQILVYGSAEIFDPIAEYELPSTIANKTRFVGYVTDSRPAKEVSRRDTQARKQVLVTLGAGEWMGETIVGSFINALKELRGFLDIEALVLTGPFLPDELRRQLEQAAQGHKIKFEQFVPDPGSYMQRSDLVIATCGYNTTTDILSYAHRALIIPRVKFRKEQLIRARRLTELGLVDFISPDLVTPRLLAAKIKHSLDSPATPLAEARQQQTIDLAGATRVVDFFEELVNRLAAREETIPC